MSDETITELKPPRFPTMLRRMWSGGEVQRWLDDHWKSHGLHGKVLVNKEALMALPKIMRDDLLAEPDD